jgi:hypothetical protein
MQDSFCVSDEEMAVITAHKGDSECQIQIEAHICPECGQHIVYAWVPECVRVYPPAQEWVDFSSYVPSVLFRDFEEARSVIDVSPKASAMLGRRCLQRLIREHIGIADKNLDKEIASVLASNRLPSYLADDLDAVRNVGNFAAHPMKSQETGEIMDVEPGEAVWTLKVLEGLFDFYFVAPRKAERRREELNCKLKDAGHPTMKTAPVIVLPQRRANV